MGKLKYFFQESLKMTTVFILASIIWIFYQSFQLFTNTFKKRKMGTILDKAYDAEDDLFKYGFSGLTVKKNDASAFCNDHTRLSKTEISVLIDKTHESMEGRYDLNSSDLYDIHAALCELQ